MEIERRTADNSAIVLVDYVTGFANLIGSQTIAENTAGGRALVQTARTFDVPLVVSLGPKDDPRGVLYPELVEALDGHPVVHRGLSFDPFEDQGFEDAVAATGRRHLVVAGLMTDGCIMQTVVGALRRDYEVSLIVDASASQSAAAHDTALMRFVQLGVTPRTWLSFASELQRSYARTETVAGFREIQSNMPGYGMFNSTVGNVRDILAKANACT